MIMPCILAAALLLPGCHTARLVQEDAMDMEQRSDTGRIQPLMVNGRYANRTPEVKVKYWKAMGTMLGKKPETRPPHPLPCDTVDIARAFPQDSAGLYVTWLGHSSFLMQIGGVRILLDPVFAANVSPVPIVKIKRFQKKVPVSAAELPLIDAVFISHGHYDHLNKPSIMALVPKTGVFLAPPGVGGILRGWGIDSVRVREYGWWQGGALRGKSGQTLNFTCTPAYHFYARSPFDRNKTLWASWVLRAGPHKVFFSGDGGYDVHFRQIGHHYGPFSLTMMENGQYSGNWPSSHLTPEQGVKAHLELKGTYMLPMHWGSFSLAPHSWQDPANRVSAEAAAKGIKLLTPRVGQTLSIGDNPETEEWWR